MDALVSTEWLAAELGAPDLRVIDATLYMVGSGRAARPEYEAAHIPAAPGSRSFRAADKAHWVGVP